MVFIESDKHNFKFLTLGGRGPRLGPLDQVTVGCGEPKAEHLISRAPPLETSTTLRRSSICTRGRESAGEEEQGSRSTTAARRVGLTGKTAGMYV